MRIEPTVFRNGYAKVNSRRGNWAGYIDGTVVCQPRYAAVPERIAMLNSEHFPGPTPLVRTGGFARIFAEAGQFIELPPQLVLLGLRPVAKFNPAVPALP